MRTLLILLLAVQVGLSISIFFQSKELSETKEEIINMKSFLEKNCDIFQNCSFNLNDLSFAISGGTIYVKK